jgi:predicted dehydrogenase
MPRLRVAVVGAGAFGRNHLRVVRASAAEGANVELTAVVDKNPEKAGPAAGEFLCTAYTDWREIEGKADAAIVATPTTSHAEVACGLIGLGMDVLVEKPIASSLEDAARMVAAAKAAGRVLQVGHLERFNPAVLAMEPIVTIPLFFEIHRMSVFAPRSLDVDVVLDLMIHDIDIVLAMTGELPSEVRASGICVMSERVDIANVRLAFPGGCVANLTASRVSTEKVRKLRLFQPHQYISIDYARQDGMAISVDERKQISFRQIASVKKEPLAAQWESFVHCVERHAEPKVGGEAAVSALRVAREILDKIEEHASIVNARLADLPRH